MEPQGRLPLWRKPWVQNALPLVTSLALHAGFAAVLLLAYATGCKVAQTRPLEAQVSVPSSELVETNLGAAVHHVGLEGDPTRPPAQEEFPEAPAGGWAPKPGQPDARAFVPAGGDDPGDEPLIGFSATRGGFVKGPDKGAAAGNAVGTGTDRGSLAPFGASGGGQPAGRSFPSRFVTVPGGNARTVVFVCDASGSMINTFGSLKTELAEAVSRLKSVQAFNIIFFQDEKAVALDPQGLVFATPDNKRRTFRWLETITTTGTTNPIPGIEQAFLSKPQLIYLLTDGDFPDNNAVKAAIARLNAGKQTRINTIIFSGTGADLDNASQSFIDLMKAIAKDNGGVFSRVKESDLR
jgi:hypothetical protein